VRSSHAVGDLAVLGAAFAALEQGIAIYDHGCRIVVANPAAARLLELPLDQILGDKPRYDAFDVRTVDGDVVTEENSGVLRALQTGETELGRLVELRLHGGGPSKWMRVNYQPLLDGDAGAPWGVVASFVQVDGPGGCSADITSTALNHAPEPIVALDPAGIALHANAAARALAAGIPELAAAIDGGEPLRPILFGHARFGLPTRDDPEDDQPIDLKCAFGQPDAPPRWIEARFRPGPPDTTAVASVCSLRDVTSEREREEELAHSALHDPLTSLANRRLMDAHLDMALARARRGEQSVGVLFLDLDGFKQVNDRYGYAAGDAVLVEFARRLAGVLRTSDAVGRSADPVSLVSRPGGDEFLVVLGDLSADPAPAIAAVIERVRRVMEEPFTVGDDHVALSVSIGAAEYPLDGRDAQTLVERAGGMTRAAKRARD
jgi:diguanylate cyclase (GGDEF)-like protein